MVQPAWSEQGVIELLLLGLSWESVQWGVFHWSVSHPQKGDLTKIYHKAQPPHEVSTPFHCSHQMILPSLYTCKNPPNYHKNNQNTSLKVKQLFIGRHVKTSPFSIYFHYAGTAGQKHPWNLKNGWAYRWILVKFPPGQSFQLLGLG